ncbi:ABC-type multidrug/protein/lipid transport system, ATPase component [Clostridium sp. SY8519]|nr:ABC-type multidrug/protein/lipid transport system, ATPase component [Clostridium sp. SY8519]
MQIIRQVQNRHHGSKPAGRHRSGATAANRLAGTDQAPRQQTGRQAQTRHHGSKPAGRHRPGSHGSKSDGKS